MEFSCGIDIIEIKRIQKAIEKLNDKFLKKIYTIKEIEYCNSKNNLKYQHYAARFAAKEAIFKAISDKLKDKYEITWTNVEIINDINGRPKITFINTDVANKIKSIDVSLSHVKEYAIANCIIVFN